MQSYLLSNPRSGPPSTVASVNGDLDGYTIPYETDEFGFDPPTNKHAFTKVEHTLSPPEPSDSELLAEWPDFYREGDQKQIEPDSYEIDKLISQTLPNATNAISRFGQITPPRTGSTDSGLGTEPESSSNSPKSAVNAAKKKRASKALKESQLQTGSTSSGRKRKASRKAMAAAVTEPISGPDDNKRKASLEKNRLAAAKCRVNKKEKTEILQRDSHNKAIENAYLKDSKMALQAQLRQLHELLLAHANMKDQCNSAEEIQQCLNHLGDQAFTRPMPPNPPVYGAFNGMAMNGMGGHPQMIPDNYFPPMGADPSSPIMHPPLPDFDRSADFDVNTPMQTD